MTQEALDGEWKSLAEIIPEVQQTHQAEVTPGADCARGAVRTQETDVTLGALGCQ